MWCMLSYTEVSLQTDDLSCLQVSSSFNLIFSRHLDNLTRLAHPPSAAALRSPNGI